MNMTTDTIAETMRQVRADCASDAVALDTTPFTPRGVGEALGTTLAMVAAVARAVELLSEQLTDESRAIMAVVNSRTEHLA